MKVSCLYVVFYVSFAAEVTNGQFRIGLRREELSWDDSAVGKMRRAPGTSFLGPVSESMYNFRNVYYYGVVRMGTPGDLLRVVFDTGSPILWVYSGSGLASYFCLSCWTHRTYHHARSNSYKPIGSGININYVKGYMNGYLSRDILTIGELSAEVVFAEATGSPFWNPLSDRYDGILGLGPCLNPTCSPPAPVIHDILRQANASLFGVYLDRSGTGESEIVFGGTNTALYDMKTLTYHPTATPAQWTVKLDSVWIGETKVIDYVDVESNAFIDTGTTSIIGPTEDVVQLYYAANFSKQEESCKEISKFPPLTFVIGGVRYTLTPQDYFSKQRILFTTRCFLQLGGLNLSQNTRFWILGDAFMGKFYTVFKLENERASKIGFAPLRNI